MINGDRIGEGLTDDGTVRGIAAHGVDGKRLGIGSKRVASADGDVVGMAFGELQWWRNEEVGRIVRLVSLIDIEVSVEDGILVPLERRVVAIGIERSPEHRVSLIVEVGHIRRVDHRCRTVDNERG